MEPLDRLIENLLYERFGKDTLLSLATVDAARGQPFVRTVDAHYAGNGWFYVVTSAASRKMQQIAKHPFVAVSGDWFTGEGIARDFGPFGSKENRHLADSLQKAFAAWIDNGHSDLSSEDTHILGICLNEAVLFHHGIRYHINFTADRMTAHIRRE